LVPHNVSNTCDERSVKVPLARRERLFEVDENR
jgi:hypothetical protein